MQKNYCPVKIKNPVSKNSLIRLLSNQRMHIIFDTEYFQDYKIDVTGNFLEVEKVSEIENGWMIVVSQKTNLITYKDSPLYLGNVNFFDESDQNKASLCVVSEHQNNAYLRVINPKNVSCTISPNQVLDVLFYTELDDTFTAFPSGKDVRMELIQHFIKHNKIINEKTYEETVSAEHLFRFRFDHKSIEFLSSHPFVKHEGGEINFLNRKNESHNLKLFCAWRGKDSIYKALLLPRIPISNMNIIAKKSQKVCMKANTQLKRQEADKLESGCNVLMSRA